MAGKEGKYNNGTLRVDRQRELLGSKNRGRDLERQQASEDISLKRD